VKRFALFLVVLSLAVANSPVKAQTPTSSLYTFDAVDSLLADALRINLNDSTAIPRITAARKAMVLIADIKIDDFLYATIEKFNEEYKLNPKDYGFNLFSGIWYGSGKVRREYIPYFQCVLNKKEVFSKYKLKHQLEK